MRATGTFEIDLEPQDDAGFPAGRSLISKTYSGDMIGSGTGQMLSKRTESGTAAYCAIEEFSGSLDGKRGGFTLVHKGLMSGAARSLEVTIVAGSGSGELESISGSMRIHQDADGHRYELTFELCGIVGRYLSHIQAHRLDAARACLAPDFTLAFAGAPFKLDRDQAVNALEWDAGANGRLEWRVTSEIDGAVTVEGVEANDFLELLGIAPLSFRSTFTVGDDRITSQEHAVDWAGQELAAAMAPLIEWARGHAADELEAIYPDDQMIYTGSMAKRWVRLARRWRTEVGSP